MRYALVVVAAIGCLCLVGPMAHGQMPDPEAAVKAAPEAMQSITADDLKRHLAVIASDDFGGRLTGTPEHEKTTAYIADHFERLKLLPLGVAGEDGKASWFHTYPVTLTKITPESGLIGTDGKLLNRFGAWATPSRRRRTEDANGGDLLIKAPLAFVGKVVKGDLTEKDLSNVIPVAFVTMDSSKDSKLNIYSASGDGMNREFGRLRSIASEFAAAKARAGIVITKKFNLSFQVAANSFSIYPSKPIVTLGKSTASMADMAPSMRIPLLVLDGEDAVAIAKACGVDVQALFENDEPPVDIEPTKEPYSLKLDFEIETIPSKNVVAYLEGTDPELKKQAVIYSAHSDHVGRAPDGSAFNGADDDGSGTVTLLEVAEAFAKLEPKDRPQRSVIFLSVSGEELGLWGSAAYVNDPTWPAENLIANINLDMIGRSTKSVPENAIALTPTYGHRKYSTLAREAAWLGKAFDLEMRNGDKFYERSDHFNFARKGIPVVFFCDDEHPDYHMPTDDVEKIEYPKLERIGRLAFLIGHRTASRPERPEVLGKRTGWFDEPSSPEGGEPKNGR